MNNYQATATIFGFKFQIYAGLYLLLKFPHEFEKIKIEGDEDIEITMLDASKLYAQAKSFTNIYNAKNSCIKSKLKDALTTLSRIGCEEDDKLIYISNMPNRPLGIESDEFGREYYLRFGELSPESQKTIQAIIDDNKLDIDTRKLIVAGFPFYSEDRQQREQAVMRKLQELLAGIDERLFALAPQILAYWAECLLDNGTEPRVEKTIEKGKMMWDLIAFSLNSSSRAEQMLIESGFDEMRVAEAASKYDDIIHRKADNFPDYNKILQLKEAYDLDNEGANTKKFLQEKITEIQKIIFPDGPDINLEEELIQPCAGLIACNILLKKSTINKIRKGMQG